MIVELLGPPGAGKSALQAKATRTLAVWSGRRCETEAEAIDRHLGGSPAARLLAPLLAGRPRRRRTLLVDLPYGLKVMLSRPRLTGAAATAILRAPVSWGHRWTLLMRWGGVAARQAYLKRRLGDDIAVFDEGQYHRAVNLFAWRAGQADTHDPRLDAEVHRYLGLVDPPEIGIFVDAPLGVIAERLAHRGLPIRLREHSPDRVVRFLAAAGRIARSIPEQTAVETRWLRVENGSTLDDAAAQLGAALAVLQAPSSSGSSWPVVRRPAVPFLRRPDRWWSARPRPLTGAQRRELRLVATQLGIGELQRAHSVGAGRSWNVVAEHPGGGGRLVLKRYKATVEGAAIASEHDVLRRLAALRIPAPRLVAGKQGATIAVVDGRSFAAFQHLDGRPMHELMTLAGARRRMVFAAGSALAQLHRQLADAQPAAFPRTGLDEHGHRYQPSAEHADRLRGAAAQLNASGASMTALADRLCDLDAQLTAAGLRSTLVHGDYGPYNLLVRPGRRLTVIDFELARPDWRLLDVATGGPRFAVSRTGLSNVRLAAFLGGYLSVDPQMRVELHMAPMLLEFLALRRAAACLLRHDASGEPGLLREAGRQLRRARALAARRHPLAGAFEAAP